MSRPYAIYDTTSGLVVQTLTAGDQAEAEANCNPGQAVIAANARVMETYVRAGVVRELPPRPGRWAQWDGGKWIDPRTDEDIAADLELSRMAGLTRIGQLRGQARLSYITDLPGQDMLYMAKADEARAYLSDPDPDPADYPLVLSEVGITAPTAYEVAQVFTNLNALWRYAAGSLDAACFQAEAAVRQAPDANTIDSILAGLAAAIT